MRLRPSHSFARSHDIERRREDVGYQPTLVPHDDGSFIGSREARSRVEDVAYPGAADPDVAFRACAGGERSRPELNRHDAARAVTGIREARRPRAMVAGRSAD